MKRTLIAGVLAGLAMFVWESVTHKTAGQMIVAFADYLVGGAVIAWLLKPRAAAA